MDNSIALVVGLFYFWGLTRTQKSIKLGTQLMNELENQLKETKDIRRKRAEIMRRLWNNGQPHDDGKTYTMEHIAEIYGSNSRSFVWNEIKWLEEQE